MTTQFDTRMRRRNGHLRLRRISAFTLVPSIPLSIVHATKTHKPTFLFALIPLFFSAILAFKVIRQARKFEHLIVTKGAEATPPQRKAAKKKIIAMFLADGILTLAYLSILVPVHLTAIKTGKGGMLTAYASMPLWLNLLVHSHSFLRVILKPIGYKLKCRRATRRGERKTRWVRIVEQDGAVSVVSDDEGIDTPASSEMGGTEVGAEGEQERYSDEKVDG
ncbi:Hypothetical protein D9617_43g040160 [Elsinoe fawcettii]|nr:Hypothetical protein D9617_43g040160 [Elsinoe fawcettii]